MLLGDGGEGFAVFCHQRHCAQCHVGLDTVYPTPGPGL